MQTANGGPRCKPYLKTTHTTDTHKECHKAPDEVICTQPIFTGLWMVPVHINISGLFFQEYVPQKPQKYSTLALHMII